MRAGCIVYVARAVPVLVDFSGKWCGPCKALAPIVEKIAAESGGKLKVVAVDVDDAPDVARRYGIRGVPTVALFRDTCPSRDSGARCWSPRAWRR